MANTTFSGPLNSQTTLVARSGDALTAGGAAAVVATTVGIGIYVGSGAPTISAPQGSLYLRSDGSGIANRAYINTNGSTTWTALSTAA